MRGRGKVKGEKGGSEGIIGEVKGGEKDGREGEGTIENEGQGEGDVRV